MNQTFAESARARSQIYDWLAAALHLPQEDMRRTEFVGSLRDACRSLGLTELDEDIDAVGKALAESETLQPLTIEYCRLFYGPNHLEAPPYESVYRDGPRLMGDSTLDVIRTYRAEGLELDDTFRNLPDHVSAEMEFMSYLSVREAEAWEAADRERALVYLSKQQSFLREHLCRWIPQFSARTITVSRTDFYRRIAGIASAFIGWDESGVAQALKA